MCELTNACGKKIDEIISVTTTDYLYQHCACKRSLRTDTKLSFRAFRVDRQFSDERASLTGIKLLFPRPRKYRLDFPRHIDLGCASVDM